MKRILPLLLLVILALFVSSAIAQTNLSSTNAPAGPAPAVSLPSLNIWQLLIPVVVPLVIAGMKYVMPKIPGPALPVIAAIIGPLTDLITSYATGNQANPILAGALGLAGVGVREVADQFKQVIATKPTPPSTT